MDEQGFSEGKVLKPKENCDNREFLCISVGSLWSWYIYILIFCIAKSLKENIKDKIKIPEICVPLKCWLQRCRISGIFMDLGINWLRKVIAILRYHRRNHHRRNHHRRNHHRRNRRRRNRRRRNRHRRNRHPRSRLCCLSYYQQS